MAILKHDQNRNSKSVISKHKRKVFVKGYTPNWTEELFVIDKVQYTNPVTYNLKELSDEKMKGSFYEPELLKAKQDIFRIEKVIRKNPKKKLALVKWKSYSDDFKSWIPFKDVVNFTIMEQENYEILSSDSENEDVELSDSNLPIERFWKRTISWKWSRMATNR